MQSFPVVLVPDDNGTLLATCPLLPEVTTFGDTPAEAIRLVGEAIEEAIGARMSRWEPVTLPGEEAADGPTAAISLQASMKLLLYVACHDANITRADLARRLDWHREQVDRLFRLDHASRIEQLEAAFMAVGRTIQLNLASAA